jgi:hypothetical protein
MARFGQSFLASLTQPSYGQGLFELGGAIGGAPAAAAEKKRRDAMMEQIMSGSPIEQARVLQQEGVRTGNAQLTMAGTKALNDAKKEEATNDINKIIAGMDPTTASEAELKAKNDKILSIATSNNLDITPYIGLHMKLISQRSKFNAEQTAADTTAVINKYIGMSSEAREAFKQTADGVKYASSILQADTELAEAERADLALQAARDTGNYKEAAPKMASAIKTRLDNITDPDLKQTLTEQYEIITATMPKDGTYTSVGDAQRITNALGTFNKTITTLVLDSQTAESRAEAVRQSTRNAVLKTTLTVSDKEVQAYIDDGSAEAALEEAGVEKTVETKFGFGANTYTEQQIREKARELAVLAREDIARTTQPELFSNTEEPSLYTAEEEKLIQDNMDEYGESREKTIAALKRKGRLK